eukprot:TRINITY_DN203_c2_g1_i2.p1 TRINITY_DN203_c2_g1~~TRINITY_DN203_c2_g1_i2.p1  ORF type:complete len:720 (+),score=170.07 TRINITY_DN203_c2_g1_i2:263-2422(+)
MRRETIDRMKMILHNDPAFIRNISVIAHVDHGKTTLVDSLLVKAGFLRDDRAGAVRMMDTKPEEQERQITIKSTGISLLVDRAEDEYVVNLVDSPGHVDFSSEVTAALRITDGALIVVDCIEGVCVQTETVMRQAMDERIKPVLHINKIDRAVLELGYTEEEMYLQFRQVIEQVNVVLATYENELLGDVQVDPVLGSVSFGSGKQGWAFTLRQFAQMNSQKTGIPVDKLLKRMWGDHFYNPKTGKFQRVPETKDGETLPRFVCKTVFRPICKIYNTCSRLDISEDEVNSLLHALDIRLSGKDKELRGQKLITRIMQTWIPAGDALVEMIVDHLPSPVEAQSYRFDALYDGPIDDECALAIKNCDPEGPAMMYVSKMVPTDDLKRFYAFGRLFSGTLRMGDNVRILGPNFTQGESNDEYFKKVNRLVLMMGRYIENEESVTCGNTLAILGLDDVLKKTGTVTTSSSACSIKPMKFSVSPVVRRTIIPLDSSKIPQYKLALARLNSSYPDLVVITKENEYIIAGAGELQLEVALNDLSELLPEGLNFSIGEPSVEFGETVTAESEVYLKKSTNKHNRLFVSAEPLSERVIEELENNRLPLDDSGKLAKALVELGWDANDAKKVWYFEGTNCVVDQTRGADYLNEVKDLIRSGFQMAVSEGGLSKENMRGVRFNIKDVKIHSDSAHRRGNQIIPAARKAFLAAQLGAQPRILEPVFKAEIQI